MPFRRYLLASALAVAFAMPAMTVSAAPFTFQGVLEQGGTPLDGDADLVFKLFNSESGSNQVGSTITASAYPVLKGVFTIDLDFVGVMFQDEIRWLQVEVDGTPLAPRIEILPAPVAGSALALQGRRVSVSVPVTGQVLKWDGSQWIPQNDAGGATYSAGSGLTLTGTTFSVDFGGSGTSTEVAHADHHHTGAHWGGNTGSPILRLENGADANFASALRGTNTAATGATIGVWGETASTTSAARGVFGAATATSGDVWGVHGRTDSPSGRGMYGIAAASSGISSGVWGQTASTTSGARGVYGFAAATTGDVWGVHGRTDSSGGRGVFGDAAPSSGNTFGVYGRSASTAGTGVRGEASAASGATIGVHGSSASSGGTGVRGEGETGVVAQGQSLGLDGAASDPGGQAIGVRGSTGSSDGAGVFAINSAASGNAFGAYAQTNSTAGTALVGDALAASGSNRGVLARTASGSGVGLRAENTGTAGLATALEAIGGSSGGTTSVFQANGTGSSWAIDASSAGPTGRALNARLTNNSATGAAVYAQVSASGARAVQGVNLAGGLAGDFTGNVSVSGTLSKGGGSFRIDHPLDPENKYLLHSFVESPDMMNIYNGNIVTGKDGLATVELPEWFDTLNRDFRYQLTVIGQFAQAIVSRKVEGNRFEIRTSLPQVEVSWQLTGIRQDAWAEKHRIPVELDKSPQERGKFLHPEAFGQPAGKRIGAVNDVKE
jgi:hypothetical protein